jgi:hypothetical protein
MVVNGEVILGSTTLGGAAIAEEVASALGEGRDRGSA